MTKMVMGIDAGTESVRAGIFDLAGKEIVVASTSYKTFYPQSGWAEQDPCEWWTALVNSVRKALSRPGVSQDNIIGLSFDTTSCSVIACGNDGTPIRRPLIWMDIRASQEALEIEKTNDARLKMSGYTVSPEWLPPKALWLKKHEPENYRAADKIVEFVDWYMYQLTGKWTLNLCNVTTRWYYNRDEGGWPREFYERIGLGDIFEKFPSIIHEIGDYVGGLTERAADELGLNPGTPVGQGGVDAFVGLLGMGVSQSGRAGLMTGSSHLLMGLTKETFHGSGIFGTFPGAVIQDLNMVEGGQISTGSILNWFVQQFCQDLKQKSEETGQSVYDLLIGEAQNIPPGSDGLLVLDYWQGNRTPYADPTVRGLIYGLSLQHRRAHIFRAIMEGIAYGTHLVLQHFQNNGFNVEEISVAGGAANSDLFLQIHADVSNIPIHVSETTEASCLGSAVLASVAAGAYPNKKEASENMVPYQKQISPIYENHMIYQDIFQKYQEAYPLFHEWMQAVSGLTR